MVRTMLLLRFEEFALHSHAASAYTEMNAISKGVSLGIFEKRRADGVELAKGETQPYVDFMGRRYAFSAEFSSRY